MGPFLLRRLRQPLLRSAESFDLDNLRDTRLTIVLPWHTFLIVAMLRAREVNSILLPTAECNAEYLVVHSFLMPGESVFVAASGLDNLDVLIARKHQDLFNGVQSSYVL